MTTTGKGIKVNKGIYVATAARLTKVATYCNKLVPLNKCFLFMLHLSPPFFLLHISVFLFSVLFIFVIYLCASSFCDPFLCDSSLYAHSLSIFSFCDPSLSLFLLSLFLSSVILLSVHILFFSAPSLFFSFPILIDLNLHFNIRSYSKYFVVISQTYFNI